MATDVKQVLARAAEITKQNGGRARGGRNVSEIGVTGLFFQDGHVYEEFLKALDGDKAIQKYAEMANNSATLGAALAAIDMLCRAVPWRVEGEEEEPRAFLESNMDDMSHSWPDFISEAMTMVVYGWAYHEIVYKLRQGPKPNEPGAGSRYTDGRIGWRKLPIRAQTSRWKWAFDERGGIQGMVQGPYSVGGLIALREPVLIPIQKALLFRPNLHKNNPEGRSALRTAYKAYYYADRLETIEGIAAERMSIGYPVMRIPGEHIVSQSATYTQAKEQIRRIRADEQMGVVLSSDRDENGHYFYDLEFATANARTTLDFDTTIKRYDVRMAQALLADFIHLGQQSVGSFALASSKTSLFAQALGTWLDQIESTLNRHAVPRLLALNGMQVENPPMFVHGDIETPELKDLAEALSKLAAAGMPIFPDPELENVIREWANLPELSDEAQQEREQRDREDAERQRRQEDQEAARLELERQVLERKGVET